jgi:uncharacterized metal-binding protein YceD (DUF177 family)
MNKKSDCLIFKIGLSGFVNVTCDRCLDFFDISVVYNGTLYVNFDNKFSDKELNYIDNDFITIAAENNEIDLSHYIYESIFLSLPYRRIHPDDEKGNSTCNKKMLKKLDQYYRERNNIIDPRWNILNRFK